TQSRNSDRAGLIEPSKENPASGNDEGFQLDISMMVVGAAQAITMTAFGVALAAFSIELAMAVMVGLIGYGVYNGLRAAADAGNEEGALGRIVTQSIGDVLLVNPIELGEAAYGFDYVSGLPLDNATRNQRLGSALGGFSAGVGLNALERARGI